MEAERLTIAVPQARLDDLRQRLNATSWPGDFGNDGGRYGVEQQWLQDMVSYWANNFDWRAQEAAMNALPQYRMVIDGIPIHFIYIKSGRSGAIPLILTRGWPGAATCALVVSPAGTATWLWERRRACSDCGGDHVALHSRDFLCTLVSLYCLTNTVGSSLRIYKEQFGKPGLSFEATGWPLLSDAKPAVPVPTGVAVAPRDVVRVPRCAVARKVNLRRCTVMPRGGPFSQPCRRRCWRRNIGHSLPNLWAGRQLGHGHQHVKSVLGRFCA